MALPTGSAAASVVGAVTAPLGDALASVTKAMGKLLDATRAVLPVLDTLGDKFKELGERFKVAFRDNIGIPLMDAVKAIGRGIQYALPTDVMSYFADAATKMGIALGAVGSAVGSLVAAAPVAAAAVAAAGLAMAQLVAKANPVVAEQFTLALNDTLAVIGQALMPVLQVATQIVRMFGDVIASFSGTLGSALGEIASSLIPIFEVLFDVFARVMGVVAQVLKFVAPLIRIVAEGIRTIFDWIGQAVKYILGLVGIEIGDSPVKKGASVGAAVRTASTGDIEGVLRKARESALTLGTAAGPNYAEMTAKNTGELITRVGSLANIMGEVLTTLRNPLKFVSNLGEIFGRDSPWKDTIDKVKDDIFYAEQKNRLAAGWAGINLALGLAGVGPLESVRRVRGDGAGVVKGADGAVGDGK